MGGSGSAWIKPKKRKGLRADALTGTPHPLFARAGQRYFPLRSSAATRVTLLLTRAGEVSCEGRREDGERRSARISTARLLAADAEGAGRHYRFVGYASRARYTTHARVVEAGAAWTQIVCPEWHPALVIDVATAMLPAPLAVDAWLTCRADLGADAPARVQPHDFGLAANLDASRYRHAEAEPRARPQDATCEDVVLFLSERDLAAALEGDAGIYLTGHRPEARRGGRAYLHASGHVQAWRAIRAIRPLPNGTRILFDGPASPVRVPVQPRLPRVGVAGGEHGRQLWLAPAWPREAELPG